MNFDLIQRHTVELYDLTHKEYEELEVPARTLLVAQRFDLFAKLYYIKNRKTSRKEALEVYNNHIKAFNPDLKEPGRDDKNGYDDFVVSFDTIIEDIEQNGFDSNKSIVPVDENGVILDGAHRVSILAYLDKTVSIVRFKNVVSKGRFDYDYFLKRGLSWKIADIIALEMVQWRPNMLIACLWPRMGGPEAKKETLSIINGRYPLCYTKTINTNMESFVRFIAKVYEAQPWVGSEANGYEGARNKALYCFASNKQISFALFEADNIEEIIAFKDEIRQRFQSEKHSIHITDNVEETKEIAAIVFDSDELNSWNQLKGGFVQHLREVIAEKVYYFKHVTLINFKVAVAKMLRH